MEKAIYSPYVQILRDRLRRLRGKARLTQRGLAERLRCLPSTVAYVELGQRRVDLIELYQYLRACGAPPARTAAEILRAFERLDAARGPEAKGTRWTKGAAPRTRRGKRS